MLVHGAVHVADALAPTGIGGSSAHFGWLAHERDDYIVLVLSHAPREETAEHAARRALGQAVRSGLVRRNVASREYIDPPKVTLAEPDALTLAEIGRIRAALPGHPLEAYVMLALGTGLRQGEQLGLAWEDVDLDAGRLHVRRELAYIAGR